MYVSWISQLLPKPNLMLPSLGDFSRLDPMTSIEYLSGYRPHQPNITSSVIDMDLKTCTFVDQWLVR